MLSVALPHWLEILSHERITELFSSPLCVASDVGAHMYLSASGMKGVKEIGSTTTDHGYALHSP